MPSKPKQNPPEQRRGMTSAEALKSWLSLCHLGRLGHVVLDAYVTVGRDKFSHQIFRLLAVGLPGKFHIRCAD